MPGPSGPRQTRTSQSVCSPCWPDWRGGLPNCLPPGGPAADQPLYFLFLEFNKKPLRHFARFLASTPYSSELCLVSRYLFHFFNFTLNPVGTWNTSCEFGWNSHCGNIVVSISLLLEYQLCPFQVQSIAFRSPLSILLFASAGQRSIDCILLFLF